MISRVTASWSGMCVVPLSYVFIMIAFAQVTARVGVFLRSFFFELKLCFSLVLIRFGCCFHFCSEQM